MTCPHCDGDLDRMMEAPWGDGDQKQSIAPYICGWCASVMLIDLREHRLITAQEAREHGIDMIAALGTNLLLWQHIEDTRRQILSLPKRRKVLR